MLYASELTWNGQDKVEGPYQLAIKRMVRAMLGAHQSPPRGIMAESGFTPGRALLDHRRARFVTGASPLARSLGNALAGFESRSLDRSGFAITV